MSCFLSFGGSLASCCRLLHYFYLLGARLSHFACLTSFAKRIFWKVLEDWGTASTHDQQSPPPPLSAKHRPHLKHETCDQETKKATDPNAVFAILICYLQQTANNPSCQFSKAPWSSLYQPSLKSSLTSVKLSEAQITTSLDQKLPRSVKPMYIHTNSPVLSTDSQEFFA